MPTDDERREVAARLRLLPDQRGIYSDRQFFELLDSKIFCLLDKALDNPRGFHTWVSNIFYLADLIEPEPEQVCQNLSKVDDIFVCSECQNETHGCMVDDFGMSVGFGKVVSKCPNCGKRVMRYAD